MARPEVILGLDDSPSALAALRCAATYARRSDLRMSAIHVSPFLADPPVSWTPGDERPEPELDLIASRARTMFTSIDPDPGWGLYFLGGTPGRTLVRVARDAQMLALGAREHTGIGRLLAGSVSHYCLSHSAVPVAAVPAPVQSCPPSHPEEIVVRAWCRATTRRSGERGLHQIVVIGK